MAFFLYCASNLIMPKSCILSYCFLFIDKPPIFFIENCLLIYFSSRQFTVDFLYGNHTQLPDFEAPAIKTYSLESSIAEKFDIILQRFELTGRMKDFYDIYNLSKTFELADDEGT